MLAEIRALLRVLAEPPATEGERREALVRVLDDLSASFHRLPDGKWAEAELEPPSQDEWATMIPQRFPELGEYSAAWPLFPIGEAAAVVSAADDLAELAVDLSEAAWRWEQLGADDAAMHLRLFVGHWGRHLLNLRRFLHALDHD